MVGVEAPEAGVEDGFAPNSGCGPPLVELVPKRLGVAVAPLVFPKIPVPAGCEVAVVLWPKGEEVPGAAEPPPPNKPVELVWAGLEDWPKRFELPLPVPPEAPEPKLSDIIYLRGRG
jgi:hypothetical protein